MVELEYVKKRKKKKIAAIISGIASLIVVTLIIISFLGHRVGSFTVKLSMNHVRLAISTEVDFDDSGYAHVPQPNTYVSFANLPAFQSATLTYENMSDHAHIDNADIEYTDKTYGGVIYNSEGKPVQMTFFKYTFFLSNVGAVPASYDFSIRITENIATGLPYNLDDLLRIRLYENEGQKRTTHVYSTYAKTKRVADEEGQYEIISYDENDPDYMKPCIPFSGTNGKYEILRRTKNKFLGGQSTRYTVMFWLEGTDSDCKGEPDVSIENGSIKLQVDITANEDN